ncbi:MAG TPA: CBS domain-containing protein, partial [Methylomirabilota bacterium]|nr:CBS domain-containing protein [Methylomirabilota bacterium]
LGQGLSETKTVGDIAAPAVLTVDQASTIQQAVELLNKKNSTAVIVTEGGKPVGIFTERDVLKRVASRQIDAKKTPVKQVMTAPIVTMPSTALVGDVLLEMSQRDIRNMPVKNDNGELIGLVSMPEVLQYARAFDIDERVRRTWKEVAEALDSEDQYTPG